MIIFVGEGEHEGCWTTIYRYYVCWYNLRLGRVLSIVPCISMLVIIVTMLMSIMFLSMLYISYMYLWTSC